MHILLSGLLFLLVAFLPDDSMSTVCWKYTFFCLYVTCRGLCVRCESPSTLEGLMEGLNEKHMGKRYYKDDNNPIVE